MQINMKVDAGPDRRTAERELEIGREIQASFLPEELPQVHGWEIASRFEAARLVAGDFYDAFPLSGGKRIGLLIGDVTDKGVGAALFMALFRSLIRAFADQHYSLGWMDVLTSGSDIAGRGGSVGKRRELLSTGAPALKNAIDLTNNFIARNHGKTNMFATIFFGLLDPSNGGLIYINGGHEPPLLVGGGRIKATLNPTGPAGGLLPDLNFSIEQVNLDPGDILFAYTDGVVDARNPVGEAFTKDRLSSLIRGIPADASNLLENIYQNLMDHISGAERFDDITMLAVRREPEPASRNVGVITSVSEEGNREKFDADV
jgi:sigma-B regulation protein RsbU (phosphoserine phosphatase)